MRTAIATKDKADAEAIAEAIGKSAGIEENQAKAEMALGAEAGPPRKFTGARNWLLLAEFNSR